MIASDENDRPAAPDRETDSQAGTAAESNIPAEDVGAPSRRSDKELERRVREELAPQFEVIQRLGSGTMASVFLAREPALKRLVAIKVLSPELRDSRARQRFEREAQAAASLSHPNIVAIHSVGRLSDDLPYIVMQYVKGRTMEERLEAEGPLSIDEARRVLANVASALATAHGKGIVHRDIRPANILHEDETGRVLLADFGIARILVTGDSDVPTRLTKTGELVGSPSWMSPEQLQGEPVTERSDIYGLGLTGYALLARSSPYDAESRREQVRAHLMETPRKLSELRPAVEPWLDDLLIRCLAKEPGHRPGASQIIRSLESPESEVEPPADLTIGSLLSNLTERRVPQLVILYALVGWGVLQVVDQLADRNVLPEIAYQLTLVSFVAGLPAAMVGAWFHGQRGDQPMRKIELWLFGALAVVWLAACAVMYMRWVAG